MSTIAEKFFKYRSYTPIPFLILMLIFQESTITSMIVGLAIALFGEFWRLWGVSYAGSETRTTGGGVGGTYLVVSGAYSHVRNPLYVGNILMYLGIGIMSMSLYPYLQIIALWFFYFQYDQIINEEEKFLTTKFGKEYQDYLDNVPRLIPSFSKYKNDNLKQPTYNLSAGIKSERRTLQAFGIIIILIIIRHYLI
ncbi:MAG: isoprenylcysteine carboxylmethyltransferase family protein [Melioribacteraceae bacterium]|nr:isoprenylcysteine carboxylmethyltransferase family protein [Melioribacteraceae bacterium]